MDTHISSASPSVVTDRFSPILVKDIDCFLYSFCSSQHPTSPISRNRIKDIESRSLPEFLFQPVSLKAFKIARSINLMSTTVALLDKLSVISLPMIPARITTNMKVTHYCIDLCTDSSQCQHTQ